MMKCTEYIWIDGAKPTQEIRNKTRILPLGNGKEVSLASFPEWGYDGSSTYQAGGHDSDLVLKPVSYVKDPLRGEGNFLVMCEVFDCEGNAHASDTRAILRKIMKNGGNELEPWLGFEQEYTLFKDSRPFGWPDNGFPPPQGPFYCGVGSTRVCGRSFVEEHTKACIDAGLMICGINAEVMLGQWEFQIGYRAVPNESPDPLTVCDHLWYARWLLFILGEKYGVNANLDNKPISGDWNGAGAHTNFSTKDMRDKKTGWNAISEFVEALGKTHKEHIAVYGHGLDQRLTGLHETCDINTFKAGERDRSASIRIPHIVTQNRCGYIEDRRPGANCDPYLVCERLLRTLLDEKK